MRLPMAATCSPVRCRYDRLPSFGCLRLPCATSVGYSAFKLALDVCCLIGNYPVAVFVRDELVSCLRAFSDSAVLLCAS